MYTANPYLVRGGVRAEDLGQLGRLLIPHIFCRFPHPVLPGPATSEFLVRGQLCGPRAMFGNDEASNPSGKCPGPDPSFIGRYYQGKGWCGQSLAGMLSLTPMVLMHRLTL